jgi:cysteine-S-conjugate beta-lyase
MSYDFDRLPARRGTGCEKWEKYDADVLPMWVADMDFASPEPVVRALRQRVEHGFFGYPGDHEGMDDLRQVIVERLAARYNWQVQPEELFFLPGVITGFDLACHTLSAPRDGVLVQTPVYPPMLKAAKMTGRSPQAMQLTHTSDGSYVIDWDAFESAFTDQTGLFILCNPHNPVGRVFRRDELERMAQACLRRGVLICSDEIHCDLLYSGQRHIPIASLDAEVARHTITLMAPSKTFNLAGLQLSIAIIQEPELRQRYRHSGKGLVPWVNLLARVAALAAYQEGTPWLEALLRYLEANRDFLYEYINHELPGIRMAKPEATYLAWLDCRGAGFQGSPHDFFLREARVALSDGALFGPGGEGFVRLNFGCPRSMLEEALERMMKAIELRASKI